MSGPGSMSVHLLIDRFSESSSEMDAPDRDKDKEGKIPSTATSEPPKQPQPSSSPPPPPQTPTISDKGLLALLGPNVSSFPFSELAYVESIKLRSEQERTKQDYYRLELANKNLAIVQTASAAQVPPLLIPSMCVRNDLDPLGPGQKTPHRSPQYPSPSQRHLHPSYSRSGSRDFVDSLNANPVPPMQFRFGAGSGPASGGPTGPGAHRRPLSPAKIGAAAVAKLANPTTPYRNPSDKPTVPSHQRHFSMPVESASRSLASSSLRLGYLRPRQPSIDLNRITASLLQKKPSSLHSPMGATSIQVKPSPAQPLHRQARQPTAPSQESMTSFQHIIQFHHWKPENPGAQFQGLPPPPSYAHKRHKSSSEASMPQIRLQPPEQFDRAESEDEDVTMDSSNTSIDAKQKR